MASEGDGGYWAAAGDAGGPLHRDEDNGGAGERLKDLGAGELRRKCVRFVRDNGSKITEARPELPEKVNPKIDLRVLFFLLTQISRRPQDNLECVEPKTRFSPGSDPRPF